MTANCKCGPAAAAGSSPATKVYWHEFCSWGQRYYHRNRRRGTERNHLSPKRSLIPNFTFKSHAFHRRCQSNLLSTTNHSILPLSNGGTLQYTTPVIMMQLYTLLSLLGMRLLGFDIVVPLCSNQWKHFFSIIQFTHNFLELALVSLDSCPICTCSLWRLVSSAFEL